jgi:cob(I)alamin adenosyltransferase
MQTESNGTSITTGTGDDGYTDIIEGKRLPKNHPIMECLGTIDELNAFLGDAKNAVSAIKTADTYATGDIKTPPVSTLGDKSTAPIIEKIQTELFSLMGIIAGMPIPPGGIGAEWLAILIKELEAELPSFTSFAVPGANPASAKLHIARTVCRRVERRMVALSLDEKTKSAIVPYINRLSDLLFLLAQKEAVG